MNQFPAGTNDTIWATVTPQQQSVIVQVTLVVVCISINHIPSTAKNEFGVLVFVIVEWEEESMAQENTSSGASSWDDYWAEFRTPPTPLSIDKGAAMMRIDVPIRISLGAEPTLSDIREVVEKTTKVAGGASVKFEITPGQRDSETITLVIQGAALLED